MGFSFANLTRWLLIAGVALAVAYSAEAQHAGRRPGQAILFSSADDDGVSSNMPSLTAKPPGLLDFANAVQSPPRNSGDSSGAEPLPEPQTPAISPAQAQQMQRLLDERKNWALLTPEQILGLPTPEKILGIAGSRRLRPAEERDGRGAICMKGRTSCAPARTMSIYGAADSASRRDFSGDQEPQVISGFWTPAGGRPGNSALMEQFIGRDAGQPRRFRPGAEKRLAEIIHPARSRRPDPRRSSKPP